MCDRPERILGEELDEVIEVNWARVWDIIMSRHLLCEPGPDCIVDAMARSNR